MANPLAEVFPKVPKPLPQGGVKEGFGVGVRVAVTVGVNVRVSVRVGVGVEVDVWAQSGAAIPVQTRRKDATINFRANDMEFLQNPVDFTISPTFLTV